MKTIVNILFTLFLINKAIPQQPLQPVGQWREHLPYKSAIDVVAGDGKIYCATPYSLFSITIASNSIDRMSKMTGLSETGVSALGYGTNQKLLIAYQNSNIDIIYRNDIFNIPDIKRDNVTGDKTIYDVYSLNKKFYLSSGLGVIVIDGERYEVDETWFISDNGGQVKVNSFTASDSFFYAATNEGLKRTAINTGNPANYLDWEVLSGANGLPSGPSLGVITLQNRVVTLINDSLFILVGNTWHLLFSEAGWNLLNINSSDNRILVSQTKNDGNAKVTVLTTDGMVLRTLQHPKLISLPRQAIFLDDNYWVADQVGGLTKFMSAGIENYRLNSPDSIASGELIVYQQKFYAAAGAVNEDWQKQFNKNGLYEFSDGQWTNYNRNNFPFLDTLADFITVTVDRRDESVWAGSYGGGLLHIRAGNIFEIFKQNSPISPAGFDPGSYRVAGLAFDVENNLWLSNYGATTNLLVRKNDGNWKTFSAPFALVENATAQIVVDDLNQKWIVSPKGNGLICFNDGNSIDDSGDDQWKLYRSGPGMGNLPSANVLCIAKDKNGFIWIGTDDGIGIVYCPELVFSPQGCDATLPVVQQGNFSSYLFKGENVRSIATDGADRKWVATENGVWLISADGESIIYQFTEENSLLLSNDVKKIAIDGNTGEVYFSTKNGICSFRSTATEGASENKDVLVFPNPVPPGFGGSISIRGLVNNALVKITEMDGRLVYQTRALGGQAVWDGRDYKGSRIASGVYLVLITDDNRKENLAARIVFINRVP